MSRGIFSTYRQGEDRVTSTLLMVLSQLPVFLLDRFLQMLSEQTDFEFLSFQNQYQHSGQGSRLDGFIHSRFGLMLETKTNSNDIREKQLKEHIAAAKRENSVLVYLTPDADRPKLLDCDGHHKVVWKSFNDLHSLISELIADEKLTISERDQFLLRSLQLMFEEDGLIRPKGLTVVIAASKAWPDYEKFGIYVCQPDRAFRDAEYLAFYAEQEIKDVVPRIKKRWKRVNLRNLKKFEEPLLDKVKRFVKENEAEEFLSNCQLIELTDRNDPQTERLEKGTIKNDCTSKISGRTVAYTQGHRYTTLKRLKDAKTTSALAD